MVQLLHTHQADVFYTHSFVVCGHFTRTPGTDPATIFRVLFATDSRCLEPSGARTTVLRAAGGHLNSHGITTPTSCGRFFRHRTTFTDVHRAQTTIRQVYSVYRRSGLRRLSLELLVTATTLALSVDRNRIPVTF